MAIAERVLAARFNRDGFPVIDHRTYVFVGDGCLMEGISHEACSLAGVLGLDKLVVLYDDNNISIDGEVHDWFADDTAKRFEAYGWEVVRNVNGHDPHEIKLALETARASRDKPTLICCKTVIGFGSPNKQGKESSHGSPLGDAEIALARQQLNWPHAPVEIPAEIRAGWDACAKGSERSTAWKQLLEAYAAAHPAEAAELRRRIAGELPADWKHDVDAAIAKLAAGDKPVATRKSSQNALEAIAPNLPELIGGSADLSESNCTLWKGATPSRAGNPTGNYFFYGVREFGMSAAMNGMVLHGGIIPYGGTFLVFSDYARNALRMAALMKIGTIFVFTHDSIGLGEDGPTHQAVEHVSSLRLIPNMETWRPADAFETAVAWRAAIERRNGPSAMALSRQNLPPQHHPAGQSNDALRGGYVLLEPSKSPDAIIMATGSEVSLAVDAAKKLNEQGRAVRVVSVPCAERFLKQDAAYRDTVLPRTITRRVSVEAGITHWWLPLVGPAGIAMGVDTFGESAPAPALFKHFGLTVDAVAARLESLF
jgi:transketolase